jgi:protocatechuate 3,4-dioxygenase beta subunit
MSKTIAVAASLLFCFLSAAALAAECTATQGAILDASYRPTAPMRSVVGKGFILTGTVRASGDCQPLPGATIEFWMAGPKGYTDALRGTVVADKKGQYRLQSIFPGTPGAGIPPHIHMNVAADGFLPIQTECFPTRGSVIGTFDIVLEPGG